MIQSAANCCQGHGPATSQILSCRCCVIWVGGGRCDCTRSLAAIKRKARPGAEVPKGCSSVPWCCTPASGHRQTPVPSCSPVPAARPGVPKLPCSLLPRAHAGTPAAAPRVLCMSQQLKLKKVLGGRAQPSATLKSSWWFVQLLITVSLIAGWVTEVRVRPGSTAGSHRLRPVPLQSGDVSAQERSSKDEEPSPWAQPAAQGAGDPRQPEGRWGRPSTRTHPPRLLHPAPCTGGFFSTVQAQPGTVPASSCALTPCTEVV